MHSTLYGNQHMNKLNCKIFFRHRETNNTNDPRPGWVRSQGASLSSTAGCDTIGVWRWLSWLRNGSLLIGWMVEVMIVGAVLRLWG